MNRWMIGERMKEWMKGWINKWMNKNTSEFGRIGAYSG